MSNVLTGVVVEDTQMAASYLDVRQIAILASLLIPLAVSFLTKKTASDGIKALVNVVGSALVSALAIWINPTGQPVTIWLFINTFLAALVASFVAYKAVWKPTGVTSAIAEKTANIGLGGNYDPEHAADPDQPDIGTFDPSRTDPEDHAAGVFDEDTEIDELPDVGQPDPNEEPILDELTEAERNG